MLIEDVLFCLSGELAINARALDELPNDVPCALRRHFPPERMVPKHREKCHFPHVRSLEVAEIYSLSVSKRVLLLVIEITSKKVVIRQHICCVKISHDLLKTSLCLGAS